MRIGVIGAGRWGRNYIRTFSNMPGVHLSAICDSKESALEAMGKLYPQASLFKDLETLLAA